MKAVISIVVINKNDRAIRDTLQACSQLDTTLAYEVIVVDSSAGKLDDIKHEYPEVAWIRFKPLPYKRVTIPEARNTGVRAARGRIIVFTDANCIPQPDWLDTLVAPILEQHETVVAGATISRGKATTHDHVYHELQATHYIDECPTINLAFTRELYDSIGGFDERFDYGSDVDFSWRVIDAGYRIRYKSDALVSHDWGNRKQEFRRSLLYGKARTRLYLKHRKLKKLLTQDMTLVIYPVYILLLPLTLVWLWYPLLLLIPLVKNVRQKPVETIIDHVAYAFGALDEVAVQPFRHTLPAVTVSSSGAAEEL